jgi:DNA-binding Lrp family transcriptional regulator
LSAQAFSSTPPDDAAIARVVARLSSEYALRAFQLLIELYGDVRAGLIAQTIHAANTAHVDARTEEGLAAAGWDGMLADEARRPIGVARLAESVGIPFESTRRIVQRLIDNGTCRREKRGVIVPASMVERPQTIRAVNANVGYVRKFVRDLDALGMAEPYELATAPESNDIVFARMVARLSCDYLLRVLRLFSDAYGDIRRAIVAQTILTANTAHLDARGAIGLRYRGIDKAPPDAVRRPITTARLAESLGVAYETMRGQTRRLADAGICAPTRGGLIVPAAVEESPALVRLMLANVVYVRRFLNDLQTMERTLAPNEGPAPAGVLRRLWG